mmetsp:Transcript_15761/g.42978  ORF Transcript_15761/g.42978 Transcript_15761/m.42978 type:complete len:459 (-) Transcript_15761:323-1699(-)|eukprot:CAMPEP_0194545114 /NCGR_PEP_ID=MMETSP0253-20130528/88633_1 /TAXON_ID=2966 /ORGANISM="Noctiluca scintillans" /LENGTH=458 /DNA_ID=CAMNT_0039392081 /DNA_START=231 /DNA_END=1607 /DNA_ORIENTATION=-
MVSCVSMLVVLAVLEQCFCSEHEQHSKRWRAHGREAFVDFLVSLGCGQCTELHWTDAPLRISSQKFGCADMDVLLPSLHWAYMTLGRRFPASIPGILVDGGANIGRATARWLAAFGDSFGRRAQRNSTQARCMICAGADATEGTEYSTLPEVVVVSVEPSNSNFALLSAYAEEGQWSEEGWIGLNVALGDQRQFQFLAVSDFAVDEVATLMYETSDPRKLQRVEVITLDDVISAAHKVFPALRISEKGVFLLKIDIEGLEPAVLRSLVDVHAPVRFVVFEFAGNVWREPLSDIVSQLYVIGYFCFFITAEQLFPVSGPFWDTVYEVPVWSNFFCGHEDDELLEMIVLLHSGVSALGSRPVLANMHLGDFAVSDATVYDLPTAQRRCEDLGRMCAGVTCKCVGPCRGVQAHNSKRAVSNCTVRAGYGGLRKTSRNEVTFLRDVAAGSLFSRYVHGLPAV